MSAVKAVFDRILFELKSGEFNSLKGVPQGKTKQIRYSRSRDFTDEVAREFMQRRFRYDLIDDLCKSRGQVLTPMNLMELQLNS